MLNIQLSKGQFFALINNVLAKTNDKVIITLRKESMCYIDSHLDIVYEFTTDKEELWDSAQELLGFENVNLGI